MEELEDAPVRSCQEFAQKWASRWNDIKDPALQEMLIDLTNVLWQIEVNTGSAKHNANVARYGIIGHFLK